jgi:pyruvate dehydrogenase E1 component
MAWGFDHMQRPEGGAVYLRLSTRSLDQPRREMSDDLTEAVTAGGYWLRRPPPGGDLCVVAMGALVPEAVAAMARVGEWTARAGLLVVTSPDRLHRDWLARGRRSHIAGLLAPLAGDAALVSVLDGHSLTLSWLGAVRGQRIAAIGVEQFGQSGDIPDLYRAYGLDTDAIVAAARRVLAEGRF